MTKLELETPALLVDLPCVGSDLERMAAFVRGVPAKLHAHFKNHKCPDPAARRVAPGAIGMSCTTLK